MLHSFFWFMLRPKVYHWHCTAATVHICIKFCGDLMFSNMRIEDQKRQSKIQHCCVTFSPVVTRALRSEFNDPTSFPFDNRSTCLPRRRMRHLANLEEAPTPQRLQEKQLGWVKPECLKSRDPTKPMKMAPLMGTHTIQNTSPCQYNIKRVMLCLSWGGVQLL